MQSDQKLKKREKKERKKRERKKENNVSHLSISHFKYLLTLILTGGGVISDLN